jgi:hypothetical protein
MYLSMIDKHLISIELEGNFFNDLTSFNTNAHSYNGNVLITLNVLDAWYSGIDNTMYVTNCVNICLSIESCVPHFSNASICFNFIFIAINSYGF